MLYIEIQSFSTEASYIFITCELRLTILPLFNIIPFILVVPLPSALIPFTVTVFKSTIPLELYTLLIFEFEIFITPVLLLLTSLVDTKLSITIVPDSLLITLPEKLEFNILTLLLVPLLLTIMRELLPVVVIESIVILPFDKLYINVPLLIEYSPTFISSTPELFIKLLMLLELFILTLLTFKLSLLLIKLDNALFTLILIFSITITPLFSIDLFVYITILPRLSSDESVILSVPLF